VVPEISRFYGIVITVNYDDHLPPHFHARYGDHRAVFLVSGELAVGWLPVRASHLVRTWARQRKSELLADWELARAHRPLLPIAPLE
jgi:hypothetical protein